MPGPREEYERRRAARQTRVDAEEARSARISHLRLVVFLAFVALAILALKDVLPLAWSLVPAVAFVVLVVVHDRVERRRARAELAVEYYRRGLRRLDDDWRGEGVQHLEFVPPGHPYAADLDLFGPASLFALLCTARTRGGEAVLARWLLHPAGASEVRARQEAVLALRERVDLREDLALLGGDVRAAIAPEALIAWAEAPPRLARSRFTPLRLLAWVLALAATVTAILGLSTDVGALPFAAVVALEVAIMRSLRSSTTAITAAVEGPRRDLEVIAALLARVEREPLQQSPRLAELAARFRAGDAGAAAAIASLARIVEWLDMRRSAIFAPFAFFWLWDLHWAIAIERWRQTHGASVARWLEALAELEALAALAGFAYENPEHPMPTIVDAGPVLRGDDLRHPLLRECVPNSLALGDPLRVLMISGSNMSGKSTFLRTVGTNVVLALAGAPVRARGLTLSPLQIGATLRIEDSLLDKSSRFYSELRRLRLLRDLARAGDPPLLFLLDEIFHGTNSHDRKQGAEAVIRSLVDDGAIGLCTTHDLALAEAIADLGERARNVHFADEVAGGELVFDHRMRPGIVQRSNAIALMRAIGLLDSAQEPRAQL